MQQHKIKNWQAQAILNSLNPSLAYLTRLKARMDSLGFPKSEPFYCLVSRALTSMQDLSAEAHRISITVELWNKAGQADAGRQPGHH